MCFRTDLIVLNEVFEANSYQIHIFIISTNRPLVPHSRVGWIPPIIETISVIWPKFLLETSKRPTYADMWYRRSITRYPPRYLNEGNSISTWWKHTPTPDAASCIVVSPLICLKFTQSYNRSRQSFPDWKHCVNTVFNTVLKVFSSVAGDETG